ncbi:MAG: flavodoxin [Bacteroidetes bacterium]|jgi:flavodoxin I|nr:flavodoxin [Bacteroidota bacterium]
MPEAKQQKIGIIFGSSTGNSENVAILLQQSFTGFEIELWDAAHANPNIIEQYDMIIFGVSTWGIGDIQEDLTEFIDAVDVDELSRKTIALYGLGDQGTYRESFVDALGKIYHLLNKMNCRIIGKCSDEGYQFDQSEALVNGEFVGLVIDEDVQPGLTKERVKNWVEQLKNELNE